MALRSRPGIGCERIFVPPHRHAIALPENLFKNWRRNHALPECLSTPPHTTFDLSIGHSFGEKLTASVTAVNVANRRVLLDNSLTFGGFHYNDPREIYGEVRYRFHY